jgi:hypothetical protein
MVLDSRSVVLLGAGASKEAGVPTTFDATAELVRQVGSHPTPWANALHFVCAQLMAHDAATEGANPYSDRLDVERVFAAIELLAERRTLEVTPFVASWQPGVDAWDGSPPGPIRFAQDYEQAIGNAHPGAAMSRVIHEQIQASKRGRSLSVYHELAERMLQALRRLVTTTGDVSYLMPLVEAGRAPGGLTIATLNYDLTVEQAAEAAGVPLTTGISEWMTHDRWDWPRDEIRLLKLHGSIDWAWDKLTSAPSRLEQSLVDVSDSPADDPRPPALVFGHRAKLRAQGPFLGLLAEFERQLAEKDRLIVIGYSFRDDHVNEILRRWINERRRRKVLVVDPAFPQRRSVPPNFRSELLDALTDRWSESLGPPIEEDRWRSRSDKDRLRVWRAQCSTALQRLVPRKGHKQPSPPTSSTA